MTKTHIDLTSDECELMIDAIIRYLKVFNQAYKKGYNFSLEEINRAKDLDVSYKQMAYGGTFKPNYFTAKHIICSMEITKSDLFQSMESDTIKKYIQAESKILLILITMATPKQRLLILNDLLTNLK